VGGYLADGTSSRRAELYDPASNSWSRLPDLPFGVNHASAATLQGRAVVLGGYVAAGRAVRTVLVGDARRWRALPPMPSRRGAAGAAVLGGRLYVVGGVGPVGLARAVFEYSPGPRRWRSVPAPTPREHLAVVAAGGRLWAIGGRTAGLDTNLDLVESWRPGEPTWRLEPPLPEARGGTAAAVVGSTIVSAGGEAPSGTIRSVFALVAGENRWRRVPDLTTPRHGLGLAAVGKAVYALAGGPEPGLHVSAANEALTLP
jgi:N-acetylneuraminic acid mutarotase